MMGVTNQGSKWSRSLCRKDNDLGEGLLDMLTIYGWGGCYCKILCFICQMSSPLLIKNQIAEKAQSDAEGRQNGLPWSRSQGSEEKQNLGAQMLAKRYVSGRGEKGHRQRLAKANNKNLFKHIRSCQERLVAGVLDCERTRGRLK